VKRKQENIDLKAQKMKRGRVEPYAVPTMVRVMPIVVQAIRQIIAGPHMTSPQEKQPRE